MTGRGYFDDIPCAVIVDCRDFAKCLAASIDGFEADDLAAPPATAGMVLQTTSDELAVLATSVAASPVPSTAHGTQDQVASASPSHSPRFSASAIVSPIVSAPTWPRRTASMRLVAPAAEGK